MNSEIVNLANRIQIKVLNHFSSVIANFAIEIDVKYSEEKNLHIINDSFRQSNFRMDIFFRRPSANKVLLFTFYDGYNGNKELSYKIDFKISSPGNKRNIYSAKVLFKHLNIPYSFNNFFLQQGVDNLFLQTDIFLKNIDELLALPEIQTILYTDAWIDIPIDMSEYK
ncbi:MAG: hypothetical protein MUC87_06500 [Bacteroidia bacterium]|jgi:hypothetical protein|nr:hypothetical protein [Bacteroidia bacterium]